jgi:hypothetical protein
VALCVFSWGAYLRVHGAINYLDYATAGFSQLPAVDLWFALHCGDVVVPLSCFIGMWVGFFRKSVWLSMGSVVGLILFSMFLEAHRCDVGGWFCDTFAW